jgi:serine/threonine protein kinase
VRACSAPLGSSFAVSNVLGSRALSNEKVCPLCGTRYAADHLFCFTDGTALVPADPTAGLVGSVIAERYRILKKIGDGGMGQVYLAEHVRIKRKSAVKIMRPGMMSDPVAIVRFNREAENASQITHPNVAAVYDFGETKDGLIYLAMEFIDGESLAKTLERETALHAVRCADIIRQSADALSVAHGLGILHRDLKPDNIMLAKTRSGTDHVKIVDFGIARVMSSEAQHVTSTGIAVGTPDFMSPEQFAGEQLDARTDIYSLALVAFHVLTGGFAFPSATSKEHLLARFTQPPRTLQEVKGDVQWPEELQATFDKALASDPEERYHDVMEFAHDFGDAVNSMPVSKTAELYLSALTARRMTPARPFTPTNEQIVSDTPTVPRDAISLGITGEGARIPTPTTPHTATTIPVVPALAGGAAEAAATAFPMESEPPAATKKRTGAMYYAAAALVVIGIVSWRVAASRSATDPSTTSNAPPAAAAPSTPTPPSAAPTDSANATTTPAATPTSAPAAALRSLDDAASGARAGVLAVLTKDGYATGFLADTSGLVLTSARLAIGQKNLEVQNDAGRLRASVVDIDPTSGVAVLRVAMKACQKCTPLALAGSEPAGSVDSVVAMGFSSRPRGAIAADSSGVTTSARIGSAMAGAPVVARSGRVVGLVNPRDGKAGLVTASALGAALSRARGKLGDASAPSDSILIAWPLVAFDAKLIKERAPKDSTGLVAFRATGKPYQVLVMTPPVIAWRAQEAAEQLTYRNAVAISKPFKYLDPIEQWSGWMRVVRDRRAVVVVNVTPDDAPAPYYPRNSPPALKGGDVKTFKLLRNGTEVAALDTATMSSVTNPETYKAKPPQQRVAVYRYDDLFPSGDGKSASSPTLDVVVADASGKLTTVPLPASLLDAVKRDFKGYSSR